MKTTTYLSRKVDIYTENISDEDERDAVTWENTTLNQQLSIIKDVKKIQRRKRVRMYEGMRTNEDMKLGQAEPQKNKEDSQNQVTPQGCQSKD